MRAPTDLLLSEKQQKRRAPPEKIKLWISTMTEIVRPTFLSLAVEGVA
jgi:hypothetical protein